MTDISNVDETPAEDKPRRGRPPKVQEAPRPSVKLAQSSAVLSHKERLKEKDAIRNRMMDS